MKLAVFCCSMALASVVGLAKHTATAEQVEEAEVNAKLDLAMHRKLTELRERLPKVARAPAPHAVASLASR